MMKGIHKPGTGTGVLLLCMMLVVIGVFCQKIRDRQMDAGFLLLQPAGKAPLEYSGQQEKAVGDAGTGGIENAHAAAKEPTKLELTWRVEKATDQIRIFRANNKCKPYNQWEMIAVLRGEKSSYMDSVFYDMEYKYKIVAYQKEGGKYKELGFDICYGVSALPKMEWYEESFSMKTTPESICIDIYARMDVPINREAYMADGFEIFRSTKGEKFKRIKSVNQKTWELTYTDKAVRGRQVYKYKVRAFRKIRNRKYYGEFSSVMQYTAVNSTGRYSVKVLTEEGDALSALTVCLTSDEGNADFLFEGWNALFINGDSSTRVAVERYSYDGKKWFVPKKDTLVLRAGQKIYLQFVGYDGERYDYREKDKPMEAFSYRRGDAAKIQSIYGRYNHYYYILDIDLDTLTASASLDGEFYF